VAWLTAENGNQLKVRKSRRKKENSDTRLTTA